MRSPRPIVRVRLAVGDVHAEPPVAGDDRPPAHRIGAELAQRAARRHAAPSALEHLRCGEQGQRLVERHRQQPLLAVERAELLALLHVRPVAAVAGEDRLAVGGVGAERARQAEQRLGVAQREVLERHRLEQARHLRLVEPGRRVVGGPELHVRAVATALGEHRQAVDLADRLVRLGSGEQRQGDVDRQLVGCQVVGHAGGVVAALDVRAEPPRLDDDEVAVGVVADRERVDGGGVDAVEVLLDESLQPGQGVVAGRGPRRSRTRAATRPSSARRRRWRRGRSRPWR